jgi:deoxyribodipyrimidine photo-lyase
MWFRRDLRLQDNLALAAAAHQDVVPLFVLESGLLPGLGEHRRQYLRASLSALDAEIVAAGGPGLQVHVGESHRLVPLIAARYSATEVMVTGEYTPYALRRDRVVAAALVADKRKLIAVDSPYLNRPGLVTKPSGEPYSVFTPYFRNWSEHVVAPVESLGSVAFRGDAVNTVDILRAALSTAAESGPADLYSTAAVTNVTAGEQIAVQILDEFLTHGAESYGKQRNRADVAGTSRLSPALHFGEIHPRTIVGRAKEVEADAAAFIRQLCWRDFYADVLWHRPRAAWCNLDERFDDFPWRTERIEEDLATWQQGRTGYPFVDAGMRQLLATGWMHNRTRMVTASFLTKDLRISWQHGARWFLRHLKDGDVANNSLGWQWTAGTGTDAAPFFRVFNPVLQGQRFDPDGNYIRTYVPELRHLSGAAVHEPWLSPSGYEAGYPERMLDHKLARLAALAASDQMKANHPQRAATRSQGTTD